MRILHISDLHLKNPMGIEAGNILDRFYSIVTANAKEKPFDQIVITGDIRDSENGICAEETINIFNKIATSANALDKQHIHLVPGNHDLNRNVGKEIEEIRRKYNYDNGTFNNAESDLPVMLNRFNDYYWNLCELYYGKVNPWQDRLYNPHYLRVYNEYAFIFINSSMSCINNVGDGNLIIGTAYIKILIDSAIEQGASTVVFFAHHPIQNLATPEETSLCSLLTIYNKIKFFWMCGDAHKNRQSSKSYIQLYQVGSLTINKSLIPDFAIYDMTNDDIHRKVYRFLEHLNNPPKSGKSTGGWKQVYLDPKKPSLYYDETLE